MNPQTLALVLQSIGLIERLFGELRPLFARLNNGESLSDSELAEFKARVDAAEAIAEAWRPGT